MSVAVESASAREEWARYWRIPVASALALAFALTHLSSLGVLMPSIERETGWSRGQISAGLTAVYSTVVLLSPFLGSLIERFGSRTVGLSGIVLYAFALSSMSLVGGSIWQWWMAWMALAVGHTLVATPVWAAAVVPLFKSSRGLALAVAMCGSGITTAVVPIFTDSLVSLVGWRQTFRVLSLAGGVVTLLLVWLWFRPPPSANRAPSASGSVGFPSAGAPESVRLRDQLGSSVFLKMVVAGFLMTMIVVTLMVHFVPMLRSGGFDQTVAARTASVIGVSAIVGRLGVGALLDRIRAPVVGLMIFSLPALSCALLLLIPTLPSAIVAAILVGFAVGAEFDVLAYAISRYFPLKLYSKLFSIVFACCSLGSATGPVSAGLLYDSLGDYRVMLLVIVPVALLNAALIGTIGGYPSKLPAASGAFS